MFKSKCVHILHSCFKGTESTNSLVICPILYDEQPLKELNYSGAK